MKNIFDIFDDQLKLQKGLGIDTDKQNILQWYNSLTAAIIEISEALAEDTRWKAFMGSNKLPHISRTNVIEETADTLLYLMNSCVFYGISFAELLEVVADKQERNIKRLLKED